MRSRHWGSLPAATLLAAITVCSPVAAEDLDIYVAPPSDGPAANVLLVIDRSAAMEAAAGAATTRMEDLKQALATVVGNPEFDDVRLALLGYATTRPKAHKDDRPTLWIDGNFHPLRGNRQALLDAVGALRSERRSPAVTALQTAQTWFRDGITASAKDDVRWFREGNVEVHPRDRTLTYPTPLDAALPCRPNVVVLMTAGRADSNGRSAFTDPSTGQTMACRAWRRSDGAEFDGTCGPEIVAHGVGDLRPGDGWPGRQSVATHVIGISPPADAWMDYFAELADSGGGDFQRTVDVGSLASALAGIIGGAASAVERAFDAPERPVDAANAVVSGDTMYLPLFQPGGGHYWLGNLRKFSIANRDGRIELLDRTGMAAVDGNGHFVDSARDLWSDEAHGGDVLAGGAASRLVGDLDRFTFLPRSDGDGNPPDYDGRPVFDTLRLERDSADRRLIEALGVEDRHAGDLIEWAGSGQRQMGAPLHTRPLVVRYSGRPDLVLLPAADGFLHAFDADSGSEVWAAIPRHLLGNLAMIRDDAAPGRVHGLDGAMTLDHRDSDGDGVVDPGEQAQVIVGMRRGGRNYYAFDVSERARPALTWEILGGQGDFSRLGQTWSRPIVATIELDGAERPVLIFSGGYDPGRDRVTGPRTADATGNAIYIVDADSGRRLRWVSDAGADLVIDAMSNAVAADPTVLDVDGDSRADRIYAAGTGGRIFRIDLVGDGLQGAAIADLNGGDAAGNRTFFHPIEVAYVSRGGTTYFALLAGSGNRTVPLSDPAAIPVRDRFHMIRDNDPWSPQRAPGDPADHRYTTLDEDDLVDATAFAGPAPDGREHPAGQAPASGNGWFIDLEPGRKVMSAATVHDHTVFFTTYSGAAADRDADTCAAAAATGESRLYAVSLLDGSPRLASVGGSGSAAGDRSRALATTGIPPSPEVLATDGPDRRPSGDLVTIVGIEDGARWKDRFHPLYWEEVFH